MTLLQYRTRVMYLSDLAYKRHHHLINPNKLPRNRDFHLDHKFSIKAGYHAHVNPLVLAHFTNLIVLPSNRNLIKSSKSSITLLELYRGYYQQITSCCS
jgi:hypothetical protein